MEARTIQLIVVVILSLGGVGAIGGAIYTWNERGEKISKLEKDLGEANQSIANAENNAKERERLYNESEASRLALANELDKVNLDAKNFRDCVDTGKCGLRVTAARCPRSSATQTQDKPDISQTAPELDPASRPTYYSLRHGIEELQKLYNGAVKDLVACSDTSNVTLGVDGAIEYGIK
jgi:hypothetical protein